jgi:peptidoglycan/LPS O-acetylase OafA/YrhL
MVFAYHLRGIAGQPDLTFAGLNWELVLRRFDCGVCLFFVLSGYLLSRPFWDGVNTGRWPNLGRYAIRRIARIIPAYWFLLFTVNAIQPAVYNAWSGLGVALQLFCLHNFAEYVYNGCVPVLWSIGIECQFYLLLPMLFVVSGWVTQRRRWAFPVVMVGIALALDIVWRAAVPALMLGRVPDKILSSPQSRVLTWSVFYFLKWFGAGIAGAWFMRRHREVAIPPVVWRAVFILGICLFGLVLSFSGEGQWRTISLWGWPLNALASLFIVLASPHLNAIGRILDNPVSRYFGSISYGLYLWHWPVLKAVFGGTLPHLLGPVSGFFAGGLLSFIITCLIASLSHFILERPATDWARHQESVPAACRNLLAWLDPRRGEIAQGKAMTAAVYTSGSP